MPYNITSYTKNKAKQLNVIIKPSTNPSKKLDVYKNNKKIASVGAIGYNDYPTFIIKQGKQFADKRKKLYHQRHLKDKGLNGLYAKKLLW
jgi:hypothetical protein